MSRIGRMPITIPAGVTINLDGNVVTVKGPKGELTREVAKALTIKIEENTLTVERPSDVKEHRSLHGLTRTLINNMVGLPDRPINDRVASTPDGEKYLAEKLAKDAKISPAINSLKAIQSEFTSI